MKTHFYNRLNEFFSVFFMTDEVLKDSATCNNLRYNNLNIYSLKTKYYNEYYYPFILNYTVNNNYCITKVIQLFSIYSLPKEPFNSQYKSNYDYLYSEKCLKLLLSTLYVLPQPKKVYNNNQQQIDYYYIILYLFSIISHNITSLDDDFKHSLITKSNRYGNENWLDLFYIYDWLKLERLSDISHYIITNFQKICLDIKITISRLSPDKASILSFFIYFVLELLDMSSERESIPSKLSKHSFLRMCSRCKEYISKYYCFSCDDLFCKNCKISIHENVFLYYKFIY